MATQTLTEILGPTLQRQGGIEMLINPNSALTPELTRQYKFDLMNIIKYEFPKIEINETEKPILAKLFYYFLGVSNDLDNSKGLLLMGNIGTGKTTFMRIFEYFTHRFNFKSKFEMESIISIELKFNKDGFKALEDYCEKKLNWCFDDLGLESITKVYGNNIRLIDNILHLRYEMFVQSGIKTHLTTNLDKQSLKKQFDERLYSRFKEMFNIISITGQDKRK